MEDKIMKDPNKRHWVQERRKSLRENYFQYIQLRKLENNFINCNDFLKKSVGLNISKSEFGVTSHVALVKVISGCDPQEFCT